MYINEFLRKLQTFSFLEAIVSILNDNEDYIVELIQRQLAEGMRGDGASLGKYSLETINIKRENNRILMGEKIALIDTGDFWESIFIRAFDNQLYIDARDWKTDMLMAKYGEETLLLSENSIDELVDIIYPCLKTKWDEHLYS